MAAVCQLLGLPGELRNRIYESIHLLEGIEVIRGCTRLHPLGYTCRQLLLEITSHTAAYATQDAAIDVRTWVFDYDFRDISKWLEQHPCVGSDVEPRFLKLHLVIWPSTSLAGLPIEGSKDDSYEIHLPTPERRLRLLKRNVETWKIGKWSAENFKEENAAGRKDPAMPKYLDLLDHRTKCKYIVRFSVKLLEQECYCPCLPKPRQQTASLPASFQLRFGNPRRDFIARLQHTIFRSYRPAAQAERDFDACNHVLWACTTASWLVCACRPNPQSPGCGCTDEVQGTESDAAVRCSGLRHELHDRNLLRGLKEFEVRCTRLLDLREETGRESMRMSFKDLWSDARKRRAEDDTRDERKKRAVDVAGMSIEREWRAEISEVPQWDVDMLSEGLDGMELDTSDLQG
nr:hypothetical protein B0A51_05546 [Rachicladosporium sp. CCFEE 5018]